MGLFIGRVKAPEMPCPDSGKDRLLEYLKETYKTGEEALLLLLKKELPRLQGEDPDWQITVLKEGVGIVITERPQRVRKILVLGLRGEKFLFRQSPHP